MSNVSCYGSGGCLHTGTDVSYFENGGLCITKPVDAANYPGASGRIRAGANCRGSNCNLRIFKNGVEEYRYDIPSNYAYAWVGWEWWDGCYCDDMEFAFYNGDTKRWSRKTSFGDSPLKYVECTGLIVKYPSVPSVHNPGVRATWLNTGERPLTVDAPLIFDGTNVVTSPVNLQPNLPLVRHYDEPGAIGIHTVEVPDKFNKSEIQPGTYEITDPCDDMICNDTCSGYDWYYQKCVDGRCVLDELIEAKSGQCGYHPCVDTGCDDICVGPDLYSQRCNTFGGYHDRGCKLDELIKANAWDDCPCSILDDGPAGHACIGGEWVEEPEPRPPPCGSYGDIDGDGVVSYNDLVMCARHIGGKITLTPEQLHRADVTGTGEITVTDIVLINNYLYGHSDTFPVCADYDPCEGVPCDPVCDDNHNLWDQKCVDGECWRTTMIERNAEQCGYDQCEGVPCDPVCVGHDMYSQRCVDGECVRAGLTEANSEQCGYVPSPYLTPEQAMARLNKGLPCYIKCILPVLDMLPGIPYTHDAWVPPFCEITEDA